MILALGVWVAVLPYLGFPYAWKNVLFTLSGLTIVYFGYLLYKEFQSVEGEKIENKTFENFSENNGEQS